jgi:hypothetical protein
MPETGGDRFEEFCCGSIVQHQRRAAVCARGRETIDLALVQLQLPKWNLIASKNE